MTELENKIQKLEERISELESKLDKVQESLELIERDIYLDEDLEEQGDAISCPYCDYEVPIYYDENLKEVQCPECLNIIELDWNGDTDENSGCSGHCSSCGGCGNDNEEK